MDPRCISSDHSRVLRVWVQEDGWLHIQLLRVRANDGSWDCKEIGISPREWDLIVKEQLQSLGYEHEPKTYE